MMIEKKYPASLQDGGLNSDDADFAVGTNQVVNGQNVRWGTTDRGVTAVVESVGGTLQKSIGLPSLTFITIGSAEDVPNNRLIFFKFCVTAPWHRITCYDKDTDIEYVVLLSTQVRGGLNFSKYSPIHSARVIDGLLIWTDEQDTQHKVNIDAAIKLNQPDYDTDEAPYIVPLEIEVISLIKRPPRYPLNVAKATQPSVIANFLGKNSFWFAYRYYYRDKETSVVSVHSQIVPYNTEVDTSNCVDISLPFAEIIDQDVVRVEVGVRVDFNPQFFGIKSWDKRRASDLAQIQSHNNGVTPLSFRFYNNQTGEPWGNSYSVKPFESCPIQSETLEIVRNRVHLGNNTSGYDTPLNTSLALTSLVQEEGGTQTGEWYLFEIYEDTVLVDSFYVIVTYDITPSGFYTYSPPVTTPPLPTSVNFVDMQFEGATYFEFLDSLGVDKRDAKIFASGSTMTINGATSFSFLNQTVYKSGASYQLGIVFFDEYDRKCGVVTSDTLLFETEDRPYDGDFVTTQALWSLSNAAATTEIPLWAKTYAIVRTKCLSTRSFVQIRVRNITYGKYDPDTETWDFNETTFGNTVDGIAVDISGLSNYGIGYVFEEGNEDLLNIYENASPLVTLRVIGQSGSWVIGNPLDIGTLGNTGSPKTDVVIEIRRPYTQSENEPYYEVAEKYEINNYKTDNRQYSVLNGNIRGDVYMLERNDAVGDYYVEAMSYNDRFWQNWFDDSGRINLIDRIGQVYKPNSIVYSNTFILGSNVNGLCEFEALNESFVPYECGQIQKLQVTSKVQNEQGAVMLAVCQMQTASIYIGEVQLVGADANAFVAQSSGVIGTINVLKGNFGTINPESVTEYRGNVFWLDAANGKVIQYSSNGLFPISNYKMTRFWRLFCEKYVSMTPQQIEALGSRPYIFTTVDPHHNELLITIPKLLNTPPKGYLPDYPSEIYPFDIWDGQAKTMVYKLGYGAGEPYWQPPYTMTPEWWATLQNDTYSCVNSIIWLHNQENYGQFYGVQYKCRIAVISNMEAAVVKVFQALSLEANKTPDWTYMEVQQPFDQVTDIMDYEWRNTESVQYAAIKRNKKQPTFSGFSVTSILTGDRMRSYAMKIMFEFSVNNIPLNLRFININFDLSKGHSNYQK